MGCGASSSSPAPYLQQYFKAMRKFQENEVDRATADMPKIMAMVFDPAKLQAYQAEANARAEEFKAKNLPLLERSFAHHDVSGDGVLGVDESSLFFSHLVDEQTEMVIALTKASMKTAIANQLKALEQMAKLYGGTKQESAEMKKEIEDSMKVVVAEFEKSQRENVEKYRADKSNRDAAAFKVLDTNSDGKLQKTEFLKAFDGSSPLALDFQAALGVTIQKSPQQTGPAEMPGDCQQQ